MLHPKFLDLSVALMVRGVTTLKKMKELLRLVEHGNSPYCKGKPRWVEVWRFDQVCDLDFHGYIEQLQPQQQKQGPLRLRKKRPSDNSARVQIFGLGANLILIWIFQDDLLFKILLVAVFYTQAQISESKIEVNVLTGFVISTLYGTEKTSQHFWCIAASHHQKKKLFWTLNGFTVSRKILKSAQPQVNLIKTSRWKNWHGTNSVEGQSNPILVHREKWHTGHVGWGR